MIVLLLYVLHQSRVRLTGLSIYTQSFGRGNNNALKTVYNYFLSWLVVEENKETDLSNSFIILI